MTMEEPWDELMGPPPVGLRRQNQDPPSTSSLPAAATAAVMVRSGGAPSGGGTPVPPAAAFGAALPRRWAQHEADPAASRAATAQAVYMASNAALHRSESGGGSSVVSRSGSAFEDDDMVEIASSSGGSGGRLHNHFEIDSTGDARSNNNESDDDDKSDDSSDIGRAYDAHHHENIRQEALRMLEVADADEHYSVHRTITGGFAAQAKPLGNQRRTKTALQGLNFVANRQNFGSNKRFYTDLTAKTPSPTRPSREDYEYGDECVVDVIGLAERSASAEATAGGRFNSSSSWSSRYSIDSTMLAMSGGAMKQSLDRMDREHSAKHASSTMERFSAANLFGSGPAATRSPQIFGSGFSFRQLHVFGKQNVVAPPTGTTNIQSGIWNDSNASSPPSGNPRIKTWQEQLFHKRQQQRRLLLCICLGLLCFIVPLASIWGARHNKSTSSSNSSSSINSNSSAIPVGADRGSVTFYVTADTPYNATDEAKLKQDLAKVSKTTSFAVHLGNIQDPNVTACANATYKNVATLLEDSSPVTVFVVPGEDDWNDCPDPAMAREAWYQNFAFFDQRWDDTPNAEEFTVFRQKDQFENWSFLQQGVLFIGIHVVNGKVPDQTEFDERNNRNYQWVMSMCQQHQAAIRAVVVFGNAEPGYAPNLSFFGPLATFWKTYDKATLYLHASGADGRDSGADQTFQGMAHVTVAQVEDNINSPPLRVTVGFGDKPFILDKTAF